MSRPSSDNRITLKITDIFFLAFSPIFYLISLCFVKNKRVWCFGAWFGLKYDDNSKYLFEYVANNRDNHNVVPVWISADQALVKVVKAKGFKAFHKYSTTGLWYQLCCKTFFCTVNSKDFYFATLTRRNKVVQLWHGAPFKKIGYDSGLSKMSMALTKARDFFIDNYSYIISPSALFDPYYCSGFGVRQSRIMRAGYPRNDGLFISPTARDEIRRYFGVSADQQLCLYLPTHRGEGKNSGVVKDIIRQFLIRDEAIENACLVILIKPHFYELKGVLEDTQGKAVKILKHFDHWDLYQVLAASDALITDYSSVFLDYEILDKPIYFLAPDLDWYNSKGRGTNLKYSYFAKEYCNNVEDLIPYLKSRKTHLAGGLNVNEDKTGNYSRKIFEKILSIG